MKKIKHLIIYALTISLLLLSIPSLTFATEEVSFPTKAAYAVDYESGKVLLNQNGEEAYGIASMTKLISAYLVYEAIENNEIKWDDVLTIDKDLVKMSLDPNLSNIPLVPEQSYTVEDALKATMISSANAATVALARHISGSEAAFVDRMRDKLSSWGITDGLIITSSGLGNADMPIETYPGSKKEDENMLSAKDMVLVATHLISDYPDVLDITKQPSFTLFEGTKEEISFDSSNEMLEGMPFETLGVDGLKTGTTDLAGACFIGTKIEDGRRIITVVMDVDQEYSRFDVTQQIFSYITDQWEYSLIAKKGDLAKTTSLPVSKGKELKVPLILKDDLYSWVHKTNSDIKIIFQKNKLAQNLIAPVAHDTIVGVEYVYDANDHLGYLTKEDDDIDYVNVVTKSTVEKENWFKLIWRAITKQHRSNNVVFIF